LVERCKEFMGTYRSILKLGSHSLTNEFHADGLEAAKAVAIATTALDICNVVITLTKPKDDADGLGFTFDFEVQVMGPGGFPQAARIARVEVRELQKR